MDKKPEIKTAATSTAKAIADYYNTLKSAGMPAEVAVELTKEYLRSLTLLTSNKKKDPPKQSVEKTSKLFNINFDKSKN